jgi:hypothetical protein
MTKINDGGAAFARGPHGFDDDAKPYGHQKGMSLRDYFAGQAIAGFLACPTMRDGMTSVEYAKGAYQVADAMIAARGDAP